VNCGRLQLQRHIYENESVMIRITILQIQLQQLYGEHMVRPSVAATDCRNDLSDQS